MRTRVLIFLHQFGGKLVLFMVFCWVGRALFAQSRTVKRIAYGEEVKSLDDFGTHHFVSIRERYACISNQVNHEVGGCAEQHQCGGTLFREDFVITAAHCVAWDEFYLRSISEVYNVSRLPNERIDGDYLGHFYETDVRVIVMNEHSIHAFYSNLALLAGSTDARYMEQIRHAFKKFIHPYYGFEKGKYSKLEHDVAMVQVCEPFRITACVRLAPMKPINELTTQYESIVERSATCLYVGFGLAEDRRQHYIGSHRLTIAGTVQMRYAWRHVACHSKCNWNRTLAKIVGFGQPLNPCRLCSDHIPPGSGTPGFGDSGGPIACDGFYVGVIMGGSYNRAKNRSEAPGYPLHCMSSAITPQRLDYYRKLSEEEDFHTLGPVLRRLTDSP